ncbi:MAG: hypothetical protein A2Z45_02320 [Chloroflexi bacterium RBG_19FT_COMBO_55_16]|nr:MAG: hypothetical protein A2Z45_02320 [Chloroflexi bacterium RBG_19FT_COMBO_55_16]
MTFEYSFIRYLSAKKSVDDRALNRYVWKSLAQALPQSRKDEPLRVLEIGAGIGTMLERAIAWDLLEHAHYTAIDAQSQNIKFAHINLDKWAAKRNFNVKKTEHGLVLANQTRVVTIDLEAIDLFAFIERERSRGTWDLLMAHAFLDLIDLPSALLDILGLLIDHGLFYFTINFDGVTSLEPLIDPALDELILALYHRTMDERLTDGKPSGDSHTGRHLFTQLKIAGAQILEAGSSDWVVFPGAQGYPQDEAYFLHFIVHTIHQALENHPELEPARFNAWVAERHAQIERQELVYITHQLDFVGRKDWG